MTSSHPDPDEDTPKDELDLVRQALDYVPEDVLQELADEDDHALLASIDERLDRIVIEEVEDEAPAWAPSEDDDATTRGTSRTEASDDQSEAVEQGQGTVRETAARSDEPEQDRPVEVVLTETQDEATKPEALDDDPSPGEGANVPNIEVVLAETPTPEEAETEEEEEEEGSPEDPEGEIARQALAQASRRTEGEPSHPPWPDDGNGHDPEIETGASPFDVLNEFTVVAPATGSIEGRWVLAIEPETAQPPEPEPEEDLGLDEFDETLEDEDPFAEEEEASGLQEDEMEDLFGDELFDEEEEAEEEEPEDELLAEAEPEQTVEEDEEFWENLLEDDEPQEEAPEPESEPAEDWLEEGWEEPEAGPEATEEETFEELWADTEDDEAEQPMTFEAATAEPEDELLFEEVEFELAEPDEPEPEEEPEGLQEAERHEEDLHEASAEAEWPTPPSQEPEPEPRGTVEDQPPSREGYTHGPYTLYHKVVETGAGEPRDLYFFARNPPEDASPTELPDGYEVGVNDRTGVPFVREEQ